MQPQSSQSQSENEDSIVCYCYRLTTGQLKAAYAKCGSLNGVEQLTRAGTGCTGCKLILQSLFGELPSDQYNLRDNPNTVQSCKKPGHRTMKAFVIADGGLESTIYSSNAVAPQFGNCDMTSNVNYRLIDHRGVTVVEGTQLLKTNETFCFETAKQTMPRPFVGMFLLSYDRSNFGAARFNVYWGNKSGKSSTHENSSTGRPRVFLPLIIDNKFLSQSNVVYAAIMNPHDRTVPFILTVFDVNGQGEIVWKSELPPLCSTWINANEFLYAPTLAKLKEGKVLLRLDSLTNTIHYALTMYFFIHNTNTDLWTVNHL